ncbi:MAG: Fic family protein [Bacilli bacterium]|nr:Fic family protein [Bacilli bacterium]
MKYLSTSEIAKKWNVSIRSVRNYCNNGRVIGAVLEGKTWLIPSEAKKPSRKTRHIIKKRSLLEVLKMEKDVKVSGGIYHKLQVEMTYNSNHIEGSKLTLDQTRYIFETRTIGQTNNNINVDDIIETSNHFQCINLAIDSAKTKLTESLIKQFHLILKNGTSDASKQWSNVGDYKILENEVGGKETCSPKEVKTKMKELLKEYNSKTNITINDIIDFYYQFESIHPFSDGNGRVGRLIAFKECLKHNIVPFIINNDLKLFYYRGLDKYKNDKQYLIDTCLCGQDIVKKYLDYFKIEY